MKNPVHPPTAPRGRKYAVAHLTHVDGPGIGVQVLAERHALLGDAARQASKIDERLVPSVVLVDERGRA